MKLEEGKLYKLNYSLPVCPFSDPCSLSMFTEYMEKESCFLKPDDIFLYLGIQSIGLLYDHDGSGTIQSCKTPLLLFKNEKYIIIENRIINWFDEIK